MILRDRRVADWLDLVDDLITFPAGNFPRLRLERQLAETFASNVSWNWMDPGVTPGFTVHVPIPGWPTVDGLLQMTAAVQSHPLLRWYALNGELRPMSLGRVPKSLVTKEGMAVIREHLTPVGMDQQLSIPYSLAPGHHRAFVLAHADTDFSNDDIDIARQIQPLLRLVDRHYRVMRRYAKPATPGVLTSREVAVTRLLAEGLTATSIARRLAISPRTVHRHLDNVYRKLGVCDRVRAVVAAHEAGLLVAQTVPAPREVGLGPAAMPTQLAGSTGMALMGEPPLA